MIAEGIAYSFLAEILQGIHQASDVYRIALYTGKAKLSPETKVYTAEGEFIGGGYGAGGTPLLGYQVTQADGEAFLNWAPAIWPNVTIQARGALLYNYTRGNRAVGVLDFGKDVTSTNGDFKVTLPPQLIAIGGK